MLDDDDDDELGFHEGKDFDNELNEVIICDDIQNALYVVVKVNRKDHDEDHDEDDDEDHDDDGVYHVQNDIVLY